MKQAELAESTHPEPRIRFGWLRAVLYSIALIFTVLIVSTITTLFLMMIPGVTLDDLSGKEIASPFVLIIYAFLLAAVYGLTVLFRKFIDRRSMADLGLMFPREARRDMLAGVAWGVLLTTITFGLLWATGQIKIIDVQPPVFSMLWMLLTLIVAATFEELTMRGYILTNFAASMNKFVALGLSSVLFTLMHSLNPNMSVLSVVNIFLAGFVLGIYYLYRRNLWFPIALHIAWNFTQGPVWGSPVSGVDSPSVLKLAFGENDLLSGGRFGFEGSLITTFVMVFAIIALWAIYRRQEAIGNPD